MSQKPIAEKLLIKEDYRILLINEPNGYGSVLGKLPDRVEVLSEPTELVDLVQVFVTSKREAEDQMRRLELFLKPKGLFWVSYPKGTSGLRTDVNRDIIRGFASTIGMQAVAMISIDTTWSALRLKIA